jgi:N-acetylneuraminic acid mutarotase
MRWGVPVLLLVAVAAVALGVAATTETSYETRLKARLDLPHVCIPRVHDSPGWQKEPGLAFDWDEPRAVTIGDQIYFGGGIKAILFLKNEGKGEVARERVPIVSLKSFERFDPATGTYTSLASLPFALNHVGITTYRGDVYVVGGHGNRLFGGDPRGEFLRYSVKDNRWTRLPPLPVPRGALAVGVIGHKLYAAGGMTAGLPGHATSRLDIYDFDTGRWSRGPDMPTAREHVGWAVFHGDLYVVGGRDDRTDALPTVERFNPRSGNWEAVAPLVVPSGGLGAVAADGRLFAVGGGNDRESTVTNAVQRYNLATNSWSLAPHMRTGRHGFGIADADGRIYTIGGSACALFSPVKTVESYDPHVRG